MPYDLVKFSGQIELDKLEFMKALDQLCKKYARDGAEYHYSSSSFGQGRPCKVN